MKICSREIGHLKRAVAVDRPPWNGNESTGRTQLSD